VRRASEVEGIDAPHFVGQQYSSNSTVQAPYCTVAGETDVAPHQRV